MSNALRLIGFVVALGLVAPLSGCVCARAPYHGRIPSRNLARAREPAPEPVAVTPAPPAPQYVVTR
jgi:hypothetical protein